MPAFPYTRSHLPAMPLPYREKEEDTLPFLPHLLFGSLHGTCMCSQEPPFLLLETGIPIHTYTFMCSHPYHLQTPGQLHCYFTVVIPRSIPLLPCPRRKRTYSQFSSGKNLPPFLPHSVVLNRTHADNTTTPPGFLCEPPCWTHTRIVVLPLVSFTLDLFVYLHVLQNYLPSVP